MEFWLAKVFDHPDWIGALIIAGKTLIVYFFLILGLRLIGKRELGQMNVYDLVLIVILGNAVQNAMMNNDNTLVGGLIAAATLLIVNRLFNIVLRRSKKLERAMVGQPVLILNDGVPIEAALTHEGISHDQLLAALREHGLTRPDQAHMCVLEIDGSISVVPSDSATFRTRRHFKALRLP
ncbi:MAG TPA: YetF domain-containing protein [Fimbriimonadaceae bacterium]|nr:YetF domain-containing protein [Fimbriimonadaceae bacterium]